MAHAEINMEFPHYPAAPVKRFTFSRLVGIFKGSSRAHMDNELPQFSDHMMRDIGLATDVRHHRDPHLMVNRHMNGFLG